MLSRLKDEETFNSPGLPAGGRGRGGGWGLKYCVRSTPVRDCKQAAETSNGWSCDGDENSLGHHPPSATRRFRGVSTKRDIFTHGTFNWTELERAYG